MNDEDQTRLLDKAIGLPGVIQAFFVSADKKVRTKQGAGQTAIADEVWVEIQRTVIVLTKASLGADTFRWTFGEKVLIIRHAVTHTFGVMVEGPESGEVFVMMQRLFKEAVGK